MHTTQRNTAEQQDRQVDKDEPTVGQRIDRICDAAQATWQGGGDTVRGVQAVLDIRGRVERNPYTMMAVAMGSGYLLSGALFSRLTVNIVSLGLRLGVRMVAIPFIQRELLGFVGVASDSSDGSA